MDESDRYALAQMRRYAESAIRLLGSRDSAAMVAAERTFFAVAYAVQTSRLSSTGRSELADIPWRNVIGMRHHLVHGYEDIRPDILVKTVRENLPPLLEALGRTLESNS